MDINLLESKWETLTPGMDQIGIKCSPTYNKLKFFQSKSLSSNKVFIIQVDKIEDFDIDDIPNFELLKISFYISNNKINLFCELLNNEYSEVFDYQIHHIVNSLCLLNKWT